MTFTPVEVIEVWAWRNLVGAVAPDPATGFYAFEYDPGWVAGDRELAPLQMPKGPGVFVFPELPVATFHRLPALLADALPDRFGSAVLDAWLVSQGVSAAAVTPLDRLAYTADRAMGALELRPPQDMGPHPDSVIAVADLVAASRAAIEGKVEGPEATEALRQLIAVGTSAGGARAKAVVAFNPETYQIRSGQLDAPAGYEQWLVKFDGASVDPTRELGAAEGHGLVEYAYHLMAVEAGIEMTECRLLPEGPRTHFMTRRFDRGPVGARHHVATLCALDHLDFNLAGAHGYEQYLSVVGRLGLTDDERAQAYRRVVFNVVAANCDDHTKNLGFLLPESGPWRLAPAYDVTFAFNPAGTWTSSHQMTVGGKRTGITVADLVELGDRFAVPGYRAAIGDVTTAVARWREHAEAAGVPGDRASAIAGVLDEHRPR